MPEEDFGAGEMQQAQEVVDMTFPARDETTRVVEPREEPFDLPASARATERTAILRGPSTRRCAAIISMPYWVIRRSSRASLS